MLRLGSMFDEWEVCCCQHWWRVCVWMHHFEYILFVRWANDHLITIFAKWSDKILIFSSLIKFYYIMWFTALIQLYQMQYLSLDFAWLFIVVNKQANSKFHFISSVYCIQSIFPLKKVSDWIQQTPSTNEANASIHLIDNISCYVMWWTASAQFKNCSLFHPSHNMRHRVFNFQFSIFCTENRFLAKSH